MRPRRSDHALTGDAHLTGIRVAGHSQRLCDFCHIGVIQYDHRAVGAKLHGHALEPGRARDGLAHLGAASETDFAHARIGTDRLAQFAARAGDTGDGFLRQPGLEQQLHKFQCRERSIAGGFEEHGVAAGNGRPDFVRHEVERKVEGRNRRHDAARYAQGKSQLTDAARGGIQRHGFAMQITRGIGG